MLMSEELFTQIKELIGTDSKLATRVGALCQKLTNVPLGEEHEQDLEYVKEEVASYSSNEVAELLTSYRCFDSEGGDVSLTLGGLQVYFSCGFAQILTVGGHEIVLEAHFSDQPSLYRDYINSEAIKQIENICKETLPEFDPSLVTDVIISLTRNRDPCSH